MPEWLSWFGICLQLRSQSQGPGIQPRIRPLLRGKTASPSPSAYHSPCFVCTLSLLSYKSYFLKKITREYTTVLYLSKNPHISGPTQCKHVLFKSQLYLIPDLSAHSSRTPCLLFHSVRLFSICNICFCSWCMGNERKIKLGTGQNRSDDIGTPGWLSG